jgi:hypothetical protein
MMAIDVDSFEESSSCRGIRTTLYEMIEAVSDEIAMDEERLVAAVVCCIMGDCKARFVGNRLNGNIWVK